MTAARKAFVFELLVLVLSEAVLVIVIERRIEPNV